MKEYTLTRDKEDPTKWTLTIPFYHGSVTIVSNIEPLWAEQVWFANALIRARSKEEALNETPLK